MLSFSCVHCGQRMKITEADGSKKATCPKCGHVVQVPTGDTASLPRRKAGRSPTGSSNSVPTVITAPPAADLSGKENATPVPRQAIHEMPTRMDSAALTPDELIAFLAPPQAPDEVGRLGPYRVLKVLGSGGMGVVYLAQDPQLQRLVALKAMLPGLAASAAARQRFLREARAIAAIQHDHVVTVFAVGEATVEGSGGVPYLAMPYLKGEPLEARVRQAAPLPAAEVLRIGREIAEGLSAIHEHGMIHRDIKPANVWLEGSSGRVKILDFGLARSSREEDQITQAGAIVGSPAFMAPEQAGRHPVDHRCDLFGLGCVLYLLCTGELPFQGNDPLGTLMAVATHDPPPPRERNPNVPAALSDLVMCLLEKKAADRPATATAVVEKITAIERGLLP